MTTGSRAWALLALVLALAGPAAGAEAVRSVPAGVVPYAMCAANLDGNRQLELVVGGLDRDAVHALRLDGTVLWRHETRGMPLAIEAGDLDGDGWPEIVALVGTSATEIVVLSRQGKLLRTIAPDVVCRLLQVADLDGDRRAEIVVAGFLGRILVYDAHGRKTLDEMLVEKNFYRKMMALHTGDVDGDGRLDIVYHPHFHLPGAIDATGRRTRGAVLTSLKPVLLLDCADLDADGKAELILGSVGELRAEGPKRKLWSASLKQTGAELALEADGLTKFPYEYGGTREAAAGNFTPDPGLEIATFATDGKFHLLSSRGKTLLHTKTKYPFLKIAAADVDRDGLDEALLARLHHPCVYVAKFTDGAADALRESAGHDAVTEGIDRLLTQVEQAPRRQVPAPTPDRKLHVLWGTEGNIGGALFKGAIRTIHKKMRQLASDRVDYAFMFTLKEGGIARDKKGGICAVGPLAPRRPYLLGLCREWERDGIPFFPVVSHAGLPTVSVETAKQILEVAPTACQGYLIWETMVNYPGEVWYDFLGRMDELARLCVERDRKILFAEEAPFWLALVSDPKARAILLKPEYKRVLVPVLKTLLPNADDTDLAAYLGSLLAGEIETWGITAEEDFWPIPLGHYRGCPDDVVMRQEILALALGARYLMIESGHVYFEPLDAAGRVNFFTSVDCRIAREARRERMALELAEKGLVGPIAPGDLLGLSPVGLRMTRTRRLERADFFWASFGSRLFDGQGLVNWDITDAMLNAGPHSLARTLYGAKKMMNGLFPATPWGLVPIVGPGVARVEGIDTLIDTDGEQVKQVGVRLPPRQGIERIREAVERGAARLPFRAEGVFLSAWRVGEGRYQVLVMDTEMFAPVDVRTTVVTRLRGLRCVDELTGKALPSEGGRVALIVPAGGWRLLRFEP